MTRWEKQNQTTRGGREKEENQCVFEFYEVYKWKKKLVKCGELTTDKINGQAMCWAHHKNLQRGWRRKTDIRRYVVSTKRGVGYEVKNSISFLPEESGSEAENFYLENRHIRIQKTPRWKNKNYYKPRK